MKLFNYWRSSASYRVRLALGFKGLPYEYVAVNLVKGEQNQDAHRGRNPWGGVPVLEVVEGGKAIEIPQSVAIVEYLEELAPLLEIEQHVLEFPFAFEPGSPSGRHVLKK